MCIQALPGERATKAPDGGFVYVIPGGGRGGRGGGPQEVRSYGSMTYTGFKSLLYPGVDHRDPRVQAAFGWIRKYWQLDGSWVNTADRWQESSPVLTTIYSLLALEETVR